MSAFARFLFAALVSLLAFLNLDSIAHAEKRVALVIGNSDYKTVPVLNTPHNDASAIGTKLSNLGFKVVTALDLDERGMLRAFSEFSKRVVTADVALLFYAGHGLQVRGTNYLVPIDASLETEIELQGQAVKLNVVLNMMEHPGRTAIVLLDACRDNPMAKRLSRSMGTRSNHVQRGFARVSTGVGTYIGFSTEPGNVALDGDGKHSPFAQALLNNIEKENLDIESIMRLVRSEVFNKTRGTQTPWGNSSLVGKGFIFNKVKKNPIASKVVKKEAKPESNTAAMNTEFAAELAYWNSIREAKNPAYFQSYIESYPKGRFVKIAKIKIDELDMEEKEVSQRQESTKDLRLNVKLETKTDKKLNPDLEAKVITENKIRSIQKHLNRVGCSAGKIDGIWGRISEQAVRNFQKYSKVKLADLSPNDDLLQHLEGKGSRVCPLKCRSGYEISNGQCVRVNAKKDANSAQKKDPIKSTRIQRKQQNKALKESGKKICYICDRGDAFRRKYCYEAGVEPHKIWRGSSTSCKKI